MHSGQDCSSASLGPAGISPIFGSESRLGEGGPGLCHALVGSTGESVAACLFEAALKIKASRTPIGDHSEVYGRSSPIANPAMRGGMAISAGDRYHPYAKYRREVAETQIVPSLRAGILIVIGLHLPFLVLDYQFYRENFPDLAVGRTTNAVSLAIILAFARRWPVTAMLIALMNAGLHLVAIIGFAGGVSSLYFPGLMLLFLGMPVLLPMTSMQAGLVVGTLFACFAALPLAGFGEFGTRGYFVNLFFPGAAAIECIFSCALLERLRFRDFLRREEIAAARDELAKLDDAKNRFSANVHHELRTPLTLMIAPLDGLRTGEYGPVPEAVREVIAVMQSNGQRLLKLINDLLDLAKLEDKKFSLVRQRFDLAPFIEELVRSTQVLAERKGIRVASDISEASSLLVVADRSALDKILINLVGNAIKFTNPGGSVTLRYRPAAGGIEIEVEDTGIGLEADQLARIFDRFAQVDASATRKHEGTGIGLSLVSELVQLHDGRVWATSRGLGQGTTMHVYLPDAEPDEVPALEEAIVDAKTFTCGVRENPADTAVDARTAASIRVDRFVEIGVSVERWHDQNEEIRKIAAPTADGAVARPRVLVADDNRDMRELLRFVLHKEFTVETAKNGLEAFERIQASPPALVITDVMMPGLSGIELCERLKASEALADIPVMIVSSKAEGEMKVRGLELGADDYVTKPFHPREVIARARSLVRLREAQREIARRNVDLEATLDRLNRTQTQLIHSEKLAAVGQLAAGIAHEVNNPVNYALNAARVLKSLGNEVQEVVGRVEQLPIENRDRLFKEAKGLRAYLDEIDISEVSRSLDEVVRIVTEGLERTRKLVGDLRDFAIPRASNGYQRVDLAAGLESTIRLVSREIAADGIKLERRGPIAGVPVDGDLGALNQVVLNLLRNAHQAIRGQDSRANPAAHRIVLEIVEGAAEIEVRVSDDGPGIDSNVLPRVFDPFFTTKSPGQGSGLGLSMCRGIVEAHAGRMSVESQVGCGATFVMTLPRAVPERAAS